MADGDEFFGWKNHRFGGCTLVLCIGIEGHVNWSSSRGVGYEAAVSGYKAKAFGDDYEGAKAWVERTLIKKLEGATRRLKAAIEARKAGGAK